VLAISLVRIGQCRCGFILFMGATEVIYWQDKTEWLGSHRIILNLSAPKGFRVNDGIDKEEFPAACHLLRRGWRC
jgi:hypothetical protein